MAEETREGSASPFGLQCCSQNSDEKFYDAVDWGWGESLKRREEELRKKELEVCKKELMLCDCEKAIRRCKTSIYY